ncbi:hypothetical protein RFI_00552 [Reticulomyxa filosa]|uniref:Uncharacterized protein n=1 Tax=Reticulomyxa filosa TaxID=46433 RepID=X6PE71_RETFI|nr:hypothetical protein RFI_00552 [Reticulomyxa filosa]|eukprot:ETO36511.1 hypothetical protein RFI_00552 [Reticulomyxa filosa]
MKDNLFRQHLSEYCSSMTEQNKRKARQLIKNYVKQMLESGSKHRLKELLTKFANWFHAQYSFSPEMQRQRTEINASISLQSKSELGQCKQNDIETLKEAIKDLKLFVSKFMELLVNIFPDISMNKSFVQAAQIELLRIFFLLV